MRTAISILCAAVLAACAVHQSPADHRDLDRLAPGYMRPDNLFSFPVKTLDTAGRLHWHPAVEWTGGGLISTSRDLARWGAAIYSSGPFGPVYGHAGWIPGYVSSLRHYPEHGVTIAFQINTDTGIIDCDDDVLRIIEERLMQVFIGKKK